MLKHLRSALDDASPHQERKVAAIYVLLLAFNAAIWTWAFIALSDSPTLLGTALLAYVLGLRHAVDADHIAAIDNVVRKLMQEGKRPVSAGLFFSLGHSLVVTIAVAVIVGTAFALQGRLHPFKVIGSVIGTGTSAFFLLSIAAINLIILRGVWRSFQRARRGEPVADHELDQLLAGRGLLARIFRPLFRMVTRSWHMFAIGFLFGLGFDTATEISLFTVAGSQASGGLSFATVMIFPALFAAGMLIGGIEALGLIASKLELAGSFWKFVEKLNGGLAGFGYLVVGIFIASWIVSYLIYRWSGVGRIVVERA